MSGDWGPWIAHNGVEMPNGLRGDERVQTWRIDFSTDYLPEGRGTNHELVCGRSSVVSDIPWHNPPHNQKVVAYRVKKEPDVKTVNQVITHPVTALLVEAQCTYTDGKLTKIHWESEE